MRIISVIAFVVLNVISFAQVELNSTIRKATVYRNNAELVSEAGGKLPAGTSEIIIKNISTSINPSSIQVSVKAAGKVSLLSATFERDYINTSTLSPEQKELKASFDKVSNEIKWVQEQKKTYTDLQTVLSTNKAIGGANTGFAPEDLSKLLEIYKTKQLEYREAFLRFALQEEQLTEEKNNLQNQLNELNAIHNKPTGVLRLQVSSLQPTQVNFKCAYVVNNAGWTPIYDLRSDGVTTPVELVYKANIYQNSGYDWNDVDLVVSTGNPSQNNNRPILYPLYTNYYQLAQTRTVNAVGSPYGKSMEKKELMLDAVEEAEYDQAFYYDNTVSQSTFSTQYEVAFKQNIPSDGKVHLVGLNTYELPSAYQYYTVPKLDRSVYLLAKVSDWGQYNLLPGKANIFFEDAYVGESYINPNTSNDTLALSLGKDEGIQMERKQLKDFSSSKLIGSNKNEEFSYEISVKNNKSNSVSLRVLDQIPVSRQKDIQVKLEDIGGAKLNEDNGELEWIVNLSPNESKKLKFAYSIKYPKDRTITGKN